MNRTRWIIAGVAALVVIGAVWGVRARGDRSAPRYRTSPVERGDLTATVSATGNVKPVVQVEVGSQVSGTLAKLNVDYNSHVHAGQVLGELEPSAFRARFAQAEASVAHAQAALKDANRQLARATELVKGDYVSQSDVETAEVQVEQRKADLKQAQAGLQSAQVDLDHTTIRAPIDGVVISRSIDIGQTVAASLQAPKLFVIANDLRNMQVETSIDEADIGRIRPGLPVQFTVDAYPDASFQGTVTQVRLEPITDQNVVTYTTVIATRNPDLRLRPGMTANVTVLVESRSQVLKVPNAALRFRPADTGGGRAGGRRGAGGAAAGADTARVNRAGDGRSAGDAAVSGAGAGRSAGEETMGTGERGAGRRHRPGASGAATEARGEAAQGTPYKPGKVYVLREGRLVALAVLTGVSDGSMTEIRGAELKPGDAVVVGLEATDVARTNLQPPPGMGGPQFRGPGGGRR